MEHATRRDRQIARPKGGSLRVFPVLGMTFVAVLVFSLSLTFADSVAAVPGSGYLTFAKVSNSERIFDRNDCRKFGGRPVSTYEHELVMRTGRSDDRLYNVLWFGGRQYVSYKIDTTSSIVRFLGIQTHAIWLCQF